jgi:hypothetical protein
MGKNQANNRHQHQTRRLGRKEGCGEKKKTRKSLPSKERNATKAEEKLDDKGDKNVGSKTLSSR